MDELYEAPEAFISANFNGIFPLSAPPEDFISDKFKGIFKKLTEANAKLLDHPAQATAANLDAKLAYVYERFLPVLKSKLRKDAITQHIATLIGLSEEATALLDCRRY